MFHVPSLQLSQTTTYGGKPAPGETFQYEFCCYFPQNPHTLYALESSIFNGMACRRLHLSDLDLVANISLGGWPYTYKLAQIIRYSCL